MRAGKNTLIGIAIIGFALLMNACTVVVKSHGNSAQNRTVSSHAYWYYYPTARVYYHITERYYYYPNGRKWRRVDQLPEGLIISHKDRVRLRIVGKPYLKHASHQRQYPAKNTVANHPSWRAREKEHPGHQNNGRGPGDRPASQANRHDNPRKPDHAAQGVAKGKQQAPGQLKFNEKVRKSLGKFRKNTPPGQVKSANAPGKSHELPGHKQKEKHQHQKADNNPGQHGKEMAQQHHGKQDKNRRQETAEQAATHRSNSGNMKSERDNPGKGGAPKRDMASNGHDKNANRKDMKRPDNAADKNRTKPNHRQQDVVKVESKGNMQARHQERKNPGSNTHGSNNQGSGKHDSATKSADKPINNQQASHTQKADKANKTKRKGAQTSDIRENGKGKPEIQAKKHNQKVKGKQQAAAKNKDKQDDEPQGDVDNDTEKGEDKVVELSTGKGNGKSKNR